MLPFVYVAGPMTKPDPLTNVHNTIRHYADRLLHDKIVVVFLPQTTVIWHLISPHPYEEWMEHDHEVIKHMNALLRIPGESPGSDREVGWAKELGIPVFHSIQELYDWVLHQWAGQREGLAAIAEKIALARVRVERERGSE